MRLLVWHAKNDDVIYDATDLDAAYLQFFHDAEEWGGPFEEILDPRAQRFLKMKELISEVYSLNSSAAAATFMNMISTYEYYGHCVTETVAPTPRFSPEL